MSDEEVMSDGPVEDDNLPEIGNEAPEQEAPEVDPEPQIDEQAPEQNIFSAFRSLPDFQGIDDDREIAVRLYQAMEREKQASHALAQYQQLLPHTRQYLEDRPEYEKWLASRSQQQPQQAPPQQAPQQESWWNPPQLRDAYKRYIVKDENGRDAISPDAPIDARHAISEYFQYRQNFAEKFLTNPEEALSPMVARLAQQQAQEIVQARFEEVQRQQYVSTLEQSNRDWLYDQSGNVSPEGEAARNYIEQAKAMGISSPEARWNYALQMVERDLLHQARSVQARQAQQQDFQSRLPQMTRQAPPAPQPAPRQSHAEANMEYLRRAASRTANRAGAMTNSPAAARLGTSFEERLRQTLEGDGLI
jgi:hypothetical protein